MVNLLLVTNTVYLSFFSHVSYVSSLSAELAPLAGFQKKKKIMTALLL